MKTLCLSLLVSFYFLFSFQSVSAQWIRQYPLAKLEHVVDIAAHQDGHGYAVGADDMILRLDPGTKTWELLQTWNSGWTLEAVDYLEGTSGAIVAAGGQGVIVSTDNGDHWTSIANAPGGIHAIQVTSATDLLVVSDEGVFRWTNNAWTDLNLPVTSGVDGGFILDPQHIYCIIGGATPKIYYTSNGGNSWFMNTEVPRPDVVKFYNALYGVAFDGREVFQTVNGGQHWTSVSNSAIHNSINDFTFGSSPNVMMAATFNGVPTISVDSGATWTQKDWSLIDERNFSVASVSDDEFWMGNDLSSIAYTSDAGTTWLETSGPDRKIMNDICFLNRNVGFAVGSTGTLLRTNNGGATWEDKSFGETRQFLSVHGLTTSDVWLGANQRIYHSADMGDSWQEKAVIPSANIIDILSVNANLILACSTSGIIYRSDDAGTTWDTVYQTNNQIRSIAKIEGNRFMATGFNGLILRSENQGLTWNVIAAPEAALQYEQTHFIGQEGWLVTSSFKKTMWHTTNAGDTWNPITLPIDRFWDGVYFITPDTGIIVGRSSAEGRAYITFNGGTNWQAGYITDFPLYGVTGLPNPNGSAWIYGFGSDIEILPYCTELPLINDLTGNASPCETDTITYSITSQGVDQYYWLFPSGWVILGDANNDTVRVKVGRNNGTISVTGLNTCGFSSPLSMNTNPVLVAKLASFEGDDSPCEAELITYTVVGTAITDYTWTFPGIDWEVLGNTDTDEVMVFAGESAGTITVTGTNVCGSAQVSKAVTPDLRPRMHSISGEGSPCEGLIAVFTADGEYYDEVVWTYPADWQVIGSANQGTIQLKIGEAAGTVSAQGINACGSSAIAEVLVTPLIIPEVTVIVNENVLTLSATGITYQWLLNGAPIDGATGAEYIATTSGDYSATIILETGCTTTTAPVSVILSSVDNGASILPLSVYPVPVNSTLYLKGITPGFDYTITDVAGALITRNSSAETSINVSTLPEGVYFLRLQQDQKSYMARFVVKSEK